MATTDHERCRVPSPPCAESMVFVLDVESTDPHAPPHGNGRVPPSPTHPSRTVRINAQPTSHAQRNTHRLEQRRVVHPRPIHPHRHRYGLEVTRIARLEQVGQ